MSTKKSQAVPAEWTPDCSGKQDYDGQLVTLSTRYWPRGGGFLLLSCGEFQGNDARPEIRPSANSTIYLGSTANDWYDKAVKLAEFECEADTEAEVKAKVEEWAQSQFDRICSALLREFHEPRS